MFAMGPAFFKQGGTAILALSGTFAAATAGAAYSSSLAITGGASPYSLTGGTGLVSGSLPAGLSLSISGSNLVLSGTPTTGGTNAFTVSVSSADAQTATSAQSVAVAAADPYFSSVVALLHFDGPDNGTTFTDVISANVWSALGSAKISTAKSAFGGASGQFNGPVQAFISTPDSTSLQLGSGDFTIEGFFSPLAPPNGFGGFYKKGENTTDGVQCGLTPTSATFRSNGISDLTASVAISSSAFTHVAFVYAGGTKKIFVAGNLVASGAGTVNNTNAANGLTVGSVSGDGTYAYLGNIDELRVTKGVARYSSNFTPPTAPFPNM